MPHHQASIQSSSFDNADGNTVPRFVPKSEDPNALVLEWLQFLKLHPFLANEFNHVSLVQDPKRNGVFLAELISFLHQSEKHSQLLKMKDFIKQRPLNVTECKQNHERVFGVIMQLIQNNTIKTTCSTLLNRQLTQATIEKLLQGDKKTLMQILHLVYKVFYEQREEGQEMQAVTHKTDVMTIMENQSI